MLSLFWDISWPFLFHFENFWEHSVHICSPFSFSWVACFPESLLFFFFFKVICTFQIAVCCQMYSWQDFIPFQASSLLNWLFPLLLRSFEVLWGPICQLLTLVPEQLESYSGRPLLCVCVVVYCRCFIPAVLPFRFLTEFITLRCSFLQKRRYFRDLVSIF